MRCALQVVDDAVHFVVGDEGAVHAHRQAGARRQVEHVALPSSASAPIWSRMVRESILLETWNAMRVGMLALIRPVITSTRRPLRREDQVDAGGARLLRQARDQLLDLLADDHHQVGELVDDDDDVAASRRAARAARASRLNGLQHAARRAFGASAIFWL